MRSVCVCFFLVLIMTPTLSYGGKVQLNPEFVEWVTLQRDAKRLEEASGAAREVLQGRPLAYRPSPVNREHMDGKSIVPASKHELLRALPVPAEESYDLRDYGFAPSSRDQGDYGTCWAFGALAALESSALKQGWASPDFSEKHLAYYGYTDIDGSMVAFDRIPLASPDSVYDQGGNNHMAIAMLSRRTGAVAEATEPYVDMGPSESAPTLPAGISPAANAPNVAWLAGVHYAPGGANVVGNIKYFLKTYGAVNVSVYSSSAYYNANTHAFYNNVTTRSNHAVTIIGWDDNYAKSNFNTSPANDGAWIVRNSWGSDWGDAGHFYASYEDLTITTKGGWAYVATPVNGVYHQYLYDPLGHTSTLQYDETSAWMANIFEAVEDQSIKYVSFGTTDVDNTVTVYVYTGVSDSQPRSGVLAYQSQSVVYDSPGYHSLELTTPVGIASGQKFSVVIKIESNSGTTYIPIEEPIQNWSSKATSSAGESFSSVDGASWNGTTANTNVCVRAFALRMPGFTVDASASVGGIITPSGSRHIAENGSATFSISPVFGYTVTDVLVDGSSVGAVSSYTFDNISSDHTITVKTAKAGNGYAAISTYAPFTLELKPDGALWAWGENSYGRLGDGTTTDRLTPIKVGSSYVAVAAGMEHALGLKADGTLWAWGRNQYGQLGDGTTTTRLTPVQIGEGFAAIAAGARNSLGLKVDGSLWAWGYNNSGQVGDGTTIQRRRPVHIGNDYTAISAGYYHSLGLKTDGTLMGWGYNGYGQLGDGTTTDKLSPVQIGTGYSSISAGTQHSLGVKTDGTLWAWGDNQREQLGDGTTTRRFRPVQIGSGYSHVAAGTYHSLGLKVDGTLWSWGDNYYGQLGDGTTTDQSSPTQVGSGFSEIAAGLNHSFGMKTDGAIWSWGQNYWGQLGNNTTTNQPSPIQVGVFYSITAAADVGGIISPSGNSVLGANSDQSFSIFPVAGYVVTDVIVDGNSVGVVPSFMFHDVTSDHTITVKTSRAGSGYSAISSHSGHTLGLQQDGTLWAWGDNRFGEFGDGTTTSQSSPVKVGDTFVSIATGTDHSLGLKADGTLYAWGRNDGGQLGDGTTSQRQTPVLVGSGYAAISAGNQHSLGLKADGTLWAWGLNSEGQIGDGTSTNRSSPVQIGSGYTAICAAPRNSFAIKADGTLMGWGDNMYAQLGDGTSTKRLSPVQIGSDYCAVAGGNYFTLGIKTDGTLWSWGSNDYGQLGDGSFTRQATPMQTNSGYTAVAAGSSHALGLKSDGTLWAWGRNSHGQLGDGSNENQNNPKQVGSNYAFISAGLSGSFGIKADGSYWGWGSNSSGQVGDGTSTNRNSPVRIQFSKPTLIPIINLLLLE